MYAADEARGRAQEFLVVQVVVRHQHDRLARLHGPARGELARRADGEFVHVRKARGRGVSAAAIDDPDAPAEFLAQPCQGDGILARSADQQGARRLHGVDEHLRVTAAGKRIGAQSGTPILQDEMSIRTDGGGEHRVGEGARRAAVFVQPKKLAEEGGVGIVHRADRCHHPGVTFAQGMGEVSERIGGGVIRRQWLE